MADRGHSLGATKRMWRGILKLAIWPWQNSISSSSLASAPGLSSQKAAGHLGVLLIGHGNHLGDGHRRVGLEVALDLHRSHVLTAHLEHVLGAAQIADAPVGVERADVAGEEPTLVVEAFGIFGRVLVIALEQVVAPHPDLTGLAGPGERGPGLQVFDLDLDAPERAA